MKTMRDLFGKVTDNRAVKLAAALVLVAAVILVPQFSKLYFQRIVIMIFFYLILALSLDFVIGYMGEVSLGHAAFYAIGAYVSVILSVNFGTNYFIGAIAGALVAAGLGIFLAISVMHLSGTYTSIVTLGFFQVIMAIILNWTSVTRGAVGFSKIPDPSIFGFAFTLDNGGIYYLAFAYVLLTMLYTRLIMQSKTGRAIVSIREDEMAAKLMGINTNRYKMLTYAMSAFFAGLAGSLYGHMMGFMNDKTFTYDMCVAALSIVILGGMGTMRGMVVGTILISPLAEVLRALADGMKSVPFIEQLQPMQWRFVIYGLVLVLMMRFRPQGILGGLSRRPYKMPKGVVLKGGGADAAA